MGKKRKKFHKKTTRRSEYSRRRKNPEKGYTALHKDFLLFLYKHKEPISSSTLFQKFSDKLSSKKELESILHRLQKNGDIRYEGKKKFQLNIGTTIFEGSFDKHSKGFGFVAVEKEQAGITLKKDPFISVGRAGTANHGDRLLIRVFNVRKDGRPEAEIIKILQRNENSIIGFYKPGRDICVVPEDPRYPSPIVIPDSSGNKANPGDAVIVEILPQPAKSGRPQGKIIEILGPPSSIDVQMKIVIATHRLPHIFPENVQQETEGICDTITLEKERKDLRKILHFTIDGETAKDFDDAIGISRTRSGYRLYVSIADVSHYVKPDTELDREAFLRGTSIYFPGRVIPMLPEKLSNNLCSLVPDQDRLTMTAILDFDKSGRNKKTSFCKSIIRSKKRLTYTEVGKILSENLSTLKNSDPELHEALTLSEALAKLLLQKRIERGSLGFNLPEAEITLKEDGRIDSIKRKDRIFAHQIIEEFMLAANEAVAETFSNLEKDFVYRIHEKPSQEKIEEFVTFAQPLGLNLPEVERDSSWFALVLKDAGGTPLEYVINNLLLRTMQQARYSVENLGHFGLAATDYTHFTSPIRRYPDLIVHRLLSELIASEKNNGVTTTNHKLGEKSAHLSTRERVAITAERDMNERLKLFYMENQLGKVFNGVISGVNENGFYVELTELFISGFVEISSLRDDYYLHDPKRLRLIGEISGKTYRLGDPVVVTPVDILHNRKKIFFEPVATESDNFYH